MRFLNLLFILSILGTPFANTYAQRNIPEFKNMQSSPLVYQILKSKEPIHIDGKALEKSWESAPWSSSFIDIEGSTKSTQPWYDTKFKMLYDDKNLYIYAQMEEPHIWADITQHDAIIYHNNDFEVFIKPDLHENHYFEIEVNPLNTILDLMMPRPYRFGGKALLHWDVKGFRSAIGIEGTLNEPNDTDKYWSVEMAIPFSAIHAFGEEKTPRSGTFWQMNFSRVQWAHEISENTYSRKQVNNKFLAEENWVWSPIGLIDMHYPERWGYVQFVNELSELVLPPNHEITQLAWNIHYLLKIYKDEEKKFASHLIHLPEYVKYIQPYLDRYQLEYIPGQLLDLYHLTLKDSKTNFTIAIDHSGRYQIL